MKIFLINLDKDADRLAAAAAQLKACGLDFERVRGVEGKTLPEKDRESAICHWRWRLSMGRPVRIGEIGCALSHFKIYRELKKGLCCVLEDDVVLDGRFREVLEYVEDHVDVTKPQVVLLSNHTGKDLPRPAKLSADGCALIPVRYGLYAEAYVVTAPAARAILTANYPLRAPCDHWTRWLRMGVIELYHSYPSVCDQNRDEYVSNIGPSGANAPKRPLMERIIRHLGFVVDRIMLFLERLLNRAF